MGYQWNFEVVAENIGSLLKSLAVTIELSILSCCLGTALAVPIAIGLLSDSYHLRTLSRLYLQVARSIPLLVLLVWFHYLVPASTEIRTSAFVNAVAAFSVSLSAFLADVLRGSAASIPAGSIEAAEALGMSASQVKRRVIIPETVRRSLPAAVALYISTFKLTTLASVIGARELLYEARRINSLDPHPLELYSFVALLFFILLVPAEPITRFLERHRWFAIYPKK